MRVITSIFKVLLIIVFIFAIYTIWNRQEELLSMAYRVLKFERKPIIELAKEIKDKYLELQEISEYIWKNKYTSEIHSRLRKDFPAIYFGQDFFKKEMRNYFRRETTLYARGLYNLDGIANIDFSDLVDEYTNTLDPEKVSLYVAYQYIKQLREAVALKDAFKAQEAVFYLTAYLDLRINKDKSIIANRDCIDNN